MDRSGFICDGVLGKKIMIDFTLIKKDKKVYPNFKLMPHYKNMYKGIILTKKLINIRFPKINKPVGINIFNQLQPYETQHSMILAELLSPNGKHNMGDKFLELFFTNVVKDILYSNSEKWIVTAEIERHDIKIRNIDNSIIIILENKSNFARDNDNQLYRYWYYGIYKIQNKIKSYKKVYNKILYISPSYNKEPDEQTRMPPEELSCEKIFIPDNTIKTIYFHDEIDEWLEKCLNAVEDAPDIFFYIKQYRDYWRFYNVV